MKIRLLIITGGLVLLVCFAFSQEFKKEKVLNFGLTAQDISTVYPWDIRDIITGATIANIYEGLTQFSQTSTSIEPALSEKWEYAPDFKTWTFFLRKNVKFQNGEPFNANSVVETFKFVKNFNGKVIKINEYKIKIEMEKSNAALPITLAMDFFMIVSSATIDSYKKKSNPPIAIGTGPFRLHSWD